MVYFHRDRSPHWVGEDLAMFELLNLSELPSMPAPWSSVDDGETWIWGDYYAIFQTQPMKMKDAMHEIAGKKPDAFRGIIYHYAMMVFYRRAIHPSARPILVVGLEQADYSARPDGINDAMWDLVRSTTDDAGLGDMMLGMFRNGAHFNLGAYEGGTTPQTVKSRFFEILEEELAVGAQPKYIGTLLDAFGHPETGVPAKTDASGCMGLVLACLFLSTALITGTSWILS
jgi:hypothetical protein